MRTRSLKNDKTDNNAFRHHRSRNEGFDVVGEEYGQMAPKFYTRDNASINLIGIYRGASIFIIANGPSLRNHDISLMKQPGVVTYGMNNGPRTFRPNFWSCVDDPSRFIKSIWLDPLITKIVPHAHLEKPIFDNATDKWAMMKTKVGDCPNVWGFHRNEKFQAERFLIEDKINWGNHTDYGGGRSIMLPVFRISHLLGFRKIYLVGCDFTMTEEYTYHFDEQRKGGAVSCNRETYRRLNEEYFPALKPYLDQAGVEVYNCNPVSGLKVFPYKPYEECIAEATGRLGDVKNERTFGMYSKPGEKDEVKIEPQMNEKKNAPSLREIPKAQYKETITIAEPQPSEPSPEVIQVEMVEVPASDMFVASNELLLQAQKQQAEEMAKKAAKKAKKAAEQQEALRIAQIQAQAQQTPSQLHAQSQTNQQLQIIAPQPPCQPESSQVIQEVKELPIVVPVIPVPPKKEKKDKPQNNHTTSNSLLRKPLEE